MLLWQDLLISTLREQKASPYLGRLGSPREQRASVLPVNLLPPPPQWHVLPSPLSSWKPLPRQNCSLWLDGTKTSSRLTLLYRVPIKFSTLSASDGHRV